MEEIDGGAPRRLRGVQLGVLALSVVTFALALGCYMAVTL